MIFQLGFLALLIVVTLFGSSRAEEATPTKPISADELMADLEFFASPECNGRLPGTPGYEAAAAYAARRFADLGLQPGGDEGWYQFLPMELNVIERCEVSLIGAGGEAEELVLGTDCACRGFTGSGTAAGEVVFVGYGLSLPDRGYDDYAGIDVSGKIVLAFKQAPPWNLEDGEGWDRRDLPRPKARTAREHGAAALLLVPRPNDEHPQPVIASVLHGPGEQVSDLPAVQLAVAKAGKLFAGGGEELSRLQARIDESREPASRILPGSATVAVAAEYEPSAQVMNVVAVLPGADPKLKDEAIIIGGHLDHVGFQGEVFWPGANDNASGASAVLGVARAFVRGPEPPRRTVIFVLLAGEEQGLMGAKHHATNPVIPLDQTVTMFNLDCVAHGDSIQLGGGKSQPALWNLARTIDAAHARLTVSRTWRGGGADAHPFWEEGVPTLYFATRNSYTHLHMVSDTRQTLNPELHAEVVRLAHRIAARVAAGEYEREEILTN